MTTALVESHAPTVTTEQLDLIKRTIAKDATPDELKLYLYDCARQGVHPLDKLIHFTKRSGKYTPITSIDFMRIRASETGEYAGSDDAVFFPAYETANSTPDAATVTVWRLVQGQRCPFVATARWAEYKPDQDFMWKKMPHTMLAKCAEALALRKGFPKQLAGLYAKEEMDQAGPQQPVTGPTEDATWKVTAAEKKARIACPDGAVFIDKIVPRARGNAEWAEITASDGKDYIANAPQLISVAYTIAQENVPAVMVTHVNGKGKTQLDNIDWWRALTTPARTVVELTADEIGF